MKVTFDENGYVNGWCMVGDNGGKEYDPPEDFDAFLDNCFCYKVSEGKLVRDTEKEKSNQLEEQKIFSPGTPGEGMLLCRESWVDLVFDPDAQPVAGTAELVHRVAEGDGNHDSARAPIMGR